jgi:hypothetical protein
MNTSLLSLRRQAIAVCALILLLPLSARSQVSLQAGAGLGFVVASGDYSGTTTDYYNGTKYGFSNGYSLLAKVRAGVIGFNVMAEAAYSSFSSHGDAEPGQGTLSLSQKIVSLRAGPEFQLVSVPLAPLKPYLGVNLQMNSFRGDATFNGTARVPSGTYTMTSTSRLGLGFAAGLLVTLGPTGALDFNISYNLMNISGKEFTVVDPAQPRRGDSYRSLNDGADPQYSSGDTVHFIGDTRAIHTLIFSVSYLFGL